jgi:hypothetical protein
LKFSNSFGVHMVCFNSLGVHLWVQTLTWCLRASSKVPGL